MDLEDGEVESVEDDDSDDYVFGGLGEDSHGSPDARIS